LDGTKGGAQRHVVPISLHKKYFAFIFQLSGWTLMAKIEPAFPIFYVQKIGNADPPFSNFKLLFFRHDVVECYHFQILNFCFSDMMLWNAQLLVWFRM